MEGRRDVVDDIFAIGQEKDAVRLMTLFIIEESKCIFSLASQVVRRQHFFCQMPTLIRQTAYDRQKKTGTRTEIPGFRKTSDHAY